MTPGIDHRQHHAPPGQTSLGIFANTVHKPSVPRPKKAPACQDESEQATRKMRYQLQRAAQGLLQQERIVHCQRSTMNAGKVKVFTSSNGASFGNLATCGSVWHCPVCAARITEGRRQELQAAITAWAKQGGEVYLMSLTFPHQINQALADNLSAFSSALRKFKNSRTYKKTMEAVASAGSIRALEVTRGNNGWHPHTHDLVFASKDQLDLLERLQSAWIETLIKVGIADRSQVNDMMQAAFDVRNGDYAAEYVAKFGFEPSQGSKIVTGEMWGAARELTKGNAKVGKRFLGRTPFTLLRDYIEGDQKAAALFQEYALHFKGKRQLFWSPKLRRALDIPEKTDEQLAAEAMPDRVLCCELSSEDWHLVLSRNARWQVLKAAEDNGAPGVAALLRDLPTRRRSHSGTYYYEALGGHKFNLPFWMRIE